MGPMLAVGTVVSAVIAFVAVANALLRAGASVSIATLVGEGLFIVMPIVWLVFARDASEPPISIGDALGLRRTAPIFIGAAFLIGATQWVWNLALVSLLQPYVGATDTGVEQLSTFVGQPSVWPVLLTVAVTPAICEEILFRGVLARGLATRFFPAAAILLSAVCFSLFHMSLVRALPTLLLGLVYGYIALRARSVLPTMCAHFANNALAILVERKTIPGIDHVLAAHPGIATAVSASATVAGIVIVARSRK